MSSTPARPGNATATLSSARRRGTRRAGQVPIVVPDKKGRPRAAALGLRLSYALRVRLLLARRCPTLCTRILPPISPLFALLELFA